MKYGGESKRKKEREEKKSHTILCVLAIIGTIAAIAGIVYAVYRYLTPDYLEDFEDDFEDFRSVGFSVVAAASACGPKSVIPARSVPLAFNISRRFIGLRFQVILL